jgi:hypothetical protein
MVWFETFLTENVTADAGIAHSTSAANSAMNPFMTFLLDDVADITRRRQLPAAWLRGVGTIAAQAAIFPSNTGSAGYTAMCMPESIA